MTDQWTCYRDNRGCTHTTNREPIDSLDASCQRCSHNMQHHGTSGCYTVVMGFQGAYVCQCEVAA